MRVEVTQEDIRRGQPGEGDHCMVALALRRQTGRRWSVATYEATTDMRRRYCDRVHVPLPEEVEDLIERFDQGQPVEPFDFHFDWQPDPLENEIYREAA